MEQRRKLRLLLASATLRNHANTILADAFADARREAATETDLDRKTFPVDCPWDLEQLLDPNGGEEE
jgi:HrpA-like RNA helicase